MIRAKEKKERSLGEHLHLKGERCNGPKCAVARRPYRPGVHGPNARRKAPSDFARQLNEKQKFKLSYGIDEKSLRLIFEAASKKHGDVANKIMELLERRLDNVVFRLGFAPSRASAHQAVLHGHIAVNDARVRSPGYQIGIGDIVKVLDQSLGRAQFKDIKERLTNLEKQSAEKQGVQQDLPAWLKVNIDKIEGHVVTLPQAVETPLEVNLVVESFSK